MKKSENIEQTEIRQMLLAGAFKLYYSDMGKLISLYKKIVM